MILKNSLFKTHTEALKNQSNVKLNMNPLTVRALHSADIPIFKASFSR